MDFSKLKTSKVVNSPIGSAQLLLRDYEGTYAAIDLTQGAPLYGPPPEMTERLIEILRSGIGYGYASRSGMPRLKELIAADLSELHQAHIRQENVLVTSGCNQAFCVAVSAIADKYDSVLLQDPFYFNHDMWLKLEGIVPKYFSGVGEDTADILSGLDKSVKALVIVSPCNPTGRTYSACGLNALADLAKEAGIMLVLDETYRMFRDNAEPPHRLYSRHDWDSHIVFVYSFSKEFAIPGYRVGALVAHPRLVSEAQKLVECMTVCASSIGQEAVIVGLERCKDWRKRMGHDVCRKGKLFKEQFADNPGGFKLKSFGGFFGWVSHPFFNSTPESVVRHLLADAGILALPGNIFTNIETNCLRMSFANIPESRIPEIAERLAGVVGLTRIDDRD